jgi:hypothetical protein
MKKSRMGALLTLLVVLGSALGSEPPVLIDDFTLLKDKGHEKSPGAQLEDVDGVKGLQLKKGDWIRLNPTTGLPPDWSKHDICKIEMFNPTKEPVRVYLLVQDNVLEPGYWAWHNRYVALTPGKNVVQFAVADLWRGEVLRQDMEGSLDPSKISLFVITAMTGHVVVQSIGIESFSVDKVKVPGLKAFDAQLSGASGFPGFTSLTEKSLYTKEAGFGWTLAPKIAESNRQVYDRKHPDNLLRDWLPCNLADLAIDVPKGKYRVHLQLEDPGAWELVQFFNHRKVEAEGKVVVDEKMNATDFKKRWFANQDNDDLPTENPFDKYLEPRYQWKTFDVEVADGQLNLNFRCADAYGNTLNALVLYPLEHAGKGSQHMLYVKELRRFDWSQAWKSVSKAPTEPVFAGKMAADATRDGFVLYTVSPYSGATNYGQFPYNHVPTDAESIETLSAIMARGEFEPISFGLRPARALGKVEVSISDLKSPDGAVLPKDALNIRVGRYRFSRYQGPMTGLYAVNERELRLFNQTPADELRCDNLMARRFWITVHAPSEIKAGTYSGSITVSTEKACKRQIPVQITVLPFALPDPEHRFAMYGAGHCLPPFYQEIREEYPKLKETVYQDLSEHGINYSYEINAQVAMKDGKAVVTNAADVEAELALRRKHAYKDGPVTLFDSPRLNALATGTTIDGMPNDKFIEAWHKEIVDIFAANKWPKVTFFYGDEPNLPELLNKLTAAHNALHAVSPEIYTGIAYHIQSPESRTMAKTLDVHHLKDFCPDEDFIEAKKTGKFLLNCNVGSDRLPFGLREWRSTVVRKTDGCITYAYAGVSVDPYYDLDAREDDYTCAPPRIDGTLTTTARWERIREGIDDYRYARALDNLVKATDTPKEIVTTANELLTQALEIGVMADRAAGLERSIVWREEAQKILTKAAK